MPTFADRRVSHGQRCESPTVVNLRILDWMSPSKQHKLRRLYGKLSFGYMMLGQKIRGVTSQKVAFFRSEFASTDFLETKVTEFSNERNRFRLSHWLCIDAKSTPGCLQTYFNFYTSTAPHSV
jgi:hypothetical protein